MAYSILSLDGGGTWALVQARVLENRFSPTTRGHEVLRNFDLVIANSGGSLVLAMLCADKELREIRRTFEDIKVLSAIFKKKFISKIPLVRDFMPNYDTENKYEVFREHLGPYGDTLLIDLPAKIGKNPNGNFVDLVITNFDYDRERAVYWRSNRSSKMESFFIEEQVNPGSGSDKFKTVTLAQAVHGASNAPVQFFDDPAAFSITEIDSHGKKKLLNKRLHWDGAVGGNNNPVKSGVLEAIANSNDREAKRKKIRVVSLGTANTILPVLYGDPGACSAQYDWLVRYSRIDGWIDDLKRMANSIISDPPDAATFEAHQILDLPYKQNDHRLIRINPLVKPRLKQQPDSSVAGWYMPGNGWSETDMHDLFTTDMAVATERGVSLINKMCDDFFKDGFDNQGIRIGGSKVEAILGHKTYSEAMNDWKSWDIGPGDIVANVAEEPVAV